MNTNQKDINTKIKLSLIAIILGLVILYIIAFMPKSNSQLVVFLVGADLFAAGIVTMWIWKKDSETIR